MVDGAVQGERKRKRPRAARACDSCRAKKYGCDEMNPCSHCRRHKVACVYTNADQFRTRLSESGGHGDDTRRPEVLSVDLSIPSDAVAATVDATRNTTLENGGSGNEGTIDVDTSLPNESQTEVNEVNTHTSNTEFYGPTSSLAFLAAIRDPRAEGSQSRDNDSNTNDLHNASLVSTLHNNAFSPGADTNQSEAFDGLLQAGHYHFRQAQPFLHSFFENLHFIHPILDQRRFMTRCEDLWFKRDDRRPSVGFLALYYSLLSLGALIREWDEDRLEGGGRFDWSRKFFCFASTILGQPRAQNDIESIQAMVFMAKVCQNELNPHLAYMYLGMAVRGSMSAGYNRQPRHKRRREGTAREDLDNDLSETVSRTWWGLYSLEVEMSFSLGRPDSLGLDDYHDQKMVLIGRKETAIISIMVEFARIIRRVSLAIYLPKTSINEKSANARAIAAEMAEWLSHIPEPIRPQLKAIQDKPDISSRSPKWAKYQQLVLELRYLNVKMILYRPFLLHTARSSPSFHSQTNHPLAEVSKCVTAAKQTIQLMHHMYCRNSFFRTWWYNATYTLYATTIILCYTSRIADKAEHSDLHPFVAQSLEILEAMHESVVAQNAARLLLKASGQIFSTTASTSGAVSATEFNQLPFNKVSLGDNLRDHSNTASSAEDVDIDQNLDFMSMLQSDDYSQFSSWLDVSSLFDNA